ncbi:MAG: sensor histidine kinase [Nitrososphaeraceae archaeon]
MIVITYPITNVDDGHYIGTVVANLPTIEFFNNYGNVNDINSQFLVAFDRKGNLLAVGASGGLVGKNFFGNETQQFINYNKELNNLTQYLLAGNIGHAIYDYGRGERLNTQSPILVGTKPVYFLQVVTPTDRIYLKINSVLFIEGIKMFSLLTGTTAAIIVLVFLLRKWYSVLQEEVTKRTRDLNESNYKLMKANESLKIKDEAQNQFINVAAHELRTPIQPILNAIYLLQSANLSTVKKNQYMDIIKRNTEKLGRLAEDILDVTRIESNSLKLMNELLDLYDLILNSIEEYKRDIQLIYKDLTINYENSNKSIYVRGDKMRLSHVLHNLLDNAGKFTKKGSITVTTAIKSDKVQVTVKDTGIGIHPEIFAKLFSKFVTKSDRGTGLGLFISKSIIEAHGGNIWAERGSQQKGATFIFTLPLLNQDKIEHQNDE